MAVPGLDEREGDPVKGEPADRGGEFEEDVEERGGDGVVSDERV